ncbi:MAG: diaminopimelate dehydrogenase [Tepidanaerobacteraceae bacterium]|jgi:diaminopimelate dehydrogenase
MKKIKVAIVGFGNVGEEVLNALLESLDMEVAGIVELCSCIDSARKKAGKVPVVSDVEELGKVDVAILSLNSRSVPKVAKEYLSKGINTVDAYDIHGKSLVELRRDLDEIAKEKGIVAISGAGWDPGTNSAIRAIFETIAPKGLTTVNYGPGMSMGHTVAVKAIPGVKEALAITIPKGMSMHQRVVYIELEEGYDINKVVKDIKNDAYFIKDETHVFEVDDVRALIDKGHGVHMARKGVSGKTHNQKIDFFMSVSNPAATSQVMVSAARASIKQKPGAYTLLEIPPVDFIYGGRFNLLERLT